MPGRLFGGAKLAARVTGTPAQGGLLTCTVDPGFTGSPSYQWLRDGGVIAGQTASVYSVAAGDVGHLLACRVTGITYTTSGLNVPLLSDGTYIASGYIAADYYQ